MKTDRSVRSIQIRLFGLLLQAFASVVLSSLALVTIVTVISISYPSRSNPFMDMPVAVRLEAYYRLRGSWDGVENVLPLAYPFENEDLWRHTILVDTNGIVQAYHGSVEAPQVGQAYIETPGDMAFLLQANGREIGQIIIAPTFFPLEWGLVLRLLGPIGMMALALFTLLIGFLLMRRVVVPLSQIIAAAREVASGNLSARVLASGPQDLRTLSDSFNHMTASLEANERQRRDLLADIAHELRTPLTVIRGQLEGVVDGVYPLDEKQIIPALEETYLLERLVNDLRLLTLAEGRQLHFESESVDLGDLAQKVVDLFYTEAREKNIFLSLHRPPGNFVVTADAQRTGQVIANLVGNALRYVPDGGKVWIDLTANDQSVALTVNDNGPGLPPADLPFIFDRFWRKDKSRARVSGGTGLGLAIAKQLIEAQGGSISARNLSEGGLQVTIEF